MADTLPIASDLLDRLDDATVRIACRSLEERLTADKRDRRRQVVAEELARAGLELRAAGPTSGFEVIVREYDAYGRTDEAKQFVSDEALRGLPRMLATSRVRDAAGVAFAEIVER